MSNKEVARFLLRKIQREEVVFQSEAVQEIIETFGMEYAYKNANGNLAISKKVLEIFRRLHGGTVDWDELGYKWVLKLDEDTVEELLNKLGID